MLHGIYVALPFPSSAVHGWEPLARAASLLSVRSTLLDSAFLQSALSYLIMDLLLHLVVISSSGVRHAGCQQFLQTKDLAAMVVASDLCSQHCCGKLSLPALSGTCNE